MASDTVSPPSGGTSTPAGDCVTLFRPAAPGVWVVPDRNIRNFRCDHPAGTSWFGLQLEGRQIPGALNRSGVEHPTGGQPLPAATTAITSHRAAVVGVRDKKTGSELCGVIDLTIEAASDNQCNSVTATDSRNGCSGALAWASTM